MKATSVRRRGRAEIEHDKLAKIAREEEIDRKLRAFDQMEQDMALLKRQTADMKKAEAAINVLHEAGMIRTNQDGSFAPVSGFEEHQAILAQRQQEGEMMAQHAHEQ